MEDGGVGGVDGIAAINVARTEEGIDTRLGTVRKEERRGRKKGRE